MEFVEYEEKIQHKNKVSIGPRGTVSYVQITDITITNNATGKSNHKTVTTTNDYSDKNRFLVLKSLDEDIHDWIVWHAVCELYDELNIRTY